MASRRENSDARRIADRGREALLERLRGAFEEAAVAHADVFESDPEKLERMVQHAAERADGLQWRRALAAAATQELGIGLGEALGHPAVVRAQAIIGAPSYEDGIAAITEGKAPPRGAERWVSAGADADEPQVKPSEVEERETEAPERSDEPAAAEAEFTEPEAKGLHVRIGVLHVDGLQELGGVGNLELLFSDDGLDVVSEIDERALVHLDWSELRDIEVQPWRARRRRRHSARLIVSATSREITFETRGSTAEEVLWRVAPALAKLDASR